MIFYCGSVTTILKKKGEREDCGGGELAE